LIVVSVARRHTSVILVLLLACTLAAALLECQGHGVFDEEPAHTAPHDQHHHGHSSSTTGHGACLLAVLPAVLCLVWFAGIWFEALCWFIPLTAPVLPPFIPPKTAAR
jgi:hypothetical protein